MIKKIIVNVILILILTAAIFTKYTRFIEINKVIPDLILIFTVFNGFFFGSSYAMFFGFFSGLAFDISTYSLIGFWALIYTVIGYLTGVSKFLDIDNPLLSSIVLFAFNIIKYIVYFFVGIIFLKSDTVFNYFRNTILIETFYTIMISIPIFLIYKHNENKSRKRINV